METMKQNLKCFVYKIKFQSVGNFDSADFIKIFPLVLFLFTDRTDSGVNTNKYKTEKTNNNIELNKH